jgi:hypothetical protein
LISLLHGFLVGSVSSGRLTMQLVMLKRITCFAYGFYSTTSTASGAESFAILKWDDTQETWSSPK